MSKSIKRRQRKLERKSAKRKEKRTQIAHEQHLSLAQRMAWASTYPIHSCFCTVAIDINGIGMVVLARTMPNRQIAFGAFLVDRYCLGVKDAFGNIQTRSDYEAFVKKCDEESGGIQQIDPPTARRLVEDAVSYAQNLGFSPHSDYRQAAPIFGDIDPTEATRTWEFGRNGKPLFIPGPYDTPARCRKIQSRLLQHCGPGQFEFLMSPQEFSFSEQAITEEDDDDWEIIDDDE